MLCKIPKIRSVSKLFAKKKTAFGDQDYGLIATKLVTTAFFEYFVDALQGLDDIDISTFKYHDSGIGTTEAVVGDTDLENKVETGREEGTQEEAEDELGDPIPTTYKSVATITYSDDREITEHGIFSADFDEELEEEQGTLMDRSVFDPISIISGNSIEFVYTFTPTGIVADIEICVDLGNILALAEQLNQYIRTLAPPLFALGIDTKKSDIFQQELYNFITKLSNLDTEDSDQARRNKDFYERRYRSPK